VLSDGEIPKFWAALDAAGLDAGSALKVILLTGQRPGEVADRRTTAVAMAREHAEGGYAYGLPKLREVFGEAAAKRMADAVGYRKDNRGFEIGAGGLPKPRSQHNIRTAIDLLGVRLRYDRFHDRLLISGLAGYEVLDDPAVDKLWLTIDERYKFLPVKDFFITVVEEAARRDSFRPILDYLDGLRRDGVERIDSWLVNYAVADDTPYVRAVGKIMLVAALGCVLSARVAAAARAARRRDA